MWRLVGLHWPTERRAIRLLLLPWRLLLLLWLLLPKRRLSWQLLRMLLGMHGRLVLVCCRRSLLKHCLRPGALVRPHPLLQKLVQLAQLVVLHAQLAHHADGICMQAKEGKEPTQREIAR